MKVCCQKLINLEFVHNRSSSCMHLDLCTLLCVEIGLGIVGREKNIEAELYDAFYGGQWMKNYPF